MGEKIHLMLCGERQVGKSTCISRVLDEVKPEFSGFITNLVPGTEEGFHDVFIHPASQPENERRYERSNLIGSRIKESRQFNTDVFETIGVELLSGDAGELILMDELGFMENDALKFQKKVMECLDGDIPVLGAIKPIVWSDFLNSIRCHDKVEVIPIYENNREDVNQYVLRRIKGILSK